MCVFTDFCRFVFIFPSIDTIAVVWLLFHVRQVSCMDTIVHLFLKDGKPIVLVARKCSPRVHTECVRHGVPRCS